MRIAPPSTLVALEHADAPALAREQRGARQGVDAGTHEDRVKARHGAEHTSHSEPVYMIKRMLLREVEYARPGSIEEAVRLLGAHDGARALAGGQTLVNVMKARAASPEVLVDLADLDELRDDRAARPTERRSSWARWSPTASSIRSPDVAAARPILAEVAATIADRQVQNRGTVGGNVCVNDPTNHLPPLFVRDGRDVHDPRGRRRAHGDAPTTSSSAST